MCCNHASQNTRQFHPSRKFSVPLPRAYLPLGLVVPVLELPMSGVVENVHLAFQGLILCSVL